MGKGLRDLAVVDSLLHDSVVQISTEIYVEAAPTSSLPLPPYPLKSKKKLLLIELTQLT